MKKYDVLKIVVIVQAVGMLALASFVIWQLWPNLHSNSAELEGSMVEDDKNLINDEIIAVIADKNITKQQLIDELMELYGDQTLQQLLLHLTIELAAQEKGITLTNNELEAAIAEASSGYESEEQYFQMMREQLGLSQKRVLEDIQDHELLIKIAISDIEVSEAEIAAYIESHREQFEPEQQLRLSWILTENDSDANQLLNKLTQGADFAELASQYSIDIYSAAMGGDLGEIEYNDPFYDRNMLEEASNMQVGDVVGPISTEDGYAILYLAGRFTPEQLTGKQRQQKAKVEVALQKVGSLIDVQQQLMNEYAIGIKR